EAAGERWTVPQGILAMLAGCFAVYSALFAIGSWLYGRFLVATMLTAVAIAGSVYVVRVWGAVSRGAPEPVEREVPARRRSACPHPRAGPSSPPRVAARACLGLRPALLSTTRSAARRT